MKGLRYSPLHVTEFCGEMQGKFKVGLARLINNLLKVRLSVLFTSWIIIRRCLLNCMYIIKNSQMIFVMQFRINKHS